MKNILVVDDDTCTRTALSMMLNANLKDCTVHTAENGAVAAALFDSLPIHAILSDISMPVMNGFELMAYVRARSSAVPIIAMSGDCGQDIRDRLRSFGVDRLLEKPFVFENAVHELASALQASALSGPAELSVEQAAFVS